MSIDRYAVIGDPIEHSLSPAMQTAAFLEAGIDAVYEAHHVTPAMVAPHVACLRYGYRGFNITVPHKERIVPELDVVERDAQLVGAVNTVVVRRTELIGFNTDGVGFGRSLESLCFQPAGATAAVFGAGGAARSIVAFLATHGASVLIAARDETKARLLAERFRGTRARSLDDPKLSAELGAADLAVNTTPLGMEHMTDETPVPVGARLPEGAIAYDLVYGRETPFLRNAAAWGCRTLDGLEMLVQQGAESFRIWTGREPDIALMRKTCERELGRRRCSVS